MWLRDIGKSEADRPDSGFDSKDGEEEDVSREEAKEEGSPEVENIKSQKVFLILFLFSGGWDLKAGGGEAAGEEKENVFHVVDSVRIIQMQKSDLIVCQINASLIIQKKSFAVAK